MSTQTIAETDVAYVPGGELAGLLSSAKSDGAAEAQLSKQIRYATGTLEHLTTSTVTIVNYLSAFEDDGPGLVASEQTVLKSGAQIGQPRVLKSDGVTADRPSTHGMGSTNTAYVDCAPDGFAAVGSFTFEEKLNFLDVDRIMVGLPLLVAGRTTIALAVHNRLGPGAYGFVATIALGTSPPDVSAELTELDNNDDQYGYASTSSATTASIDPVSIRMVAAPSPKPADEPAYEIHRLIVQVGLAQYTVVDGDTLGDIARTWYGDPNEWHKIYAHNKDIIKDPNVIGSGQILTIP